MARRETSFRACPPQPALARPSPDESRLRPRRLLQPKSPAGESYPGSLPKCGIQPFACKGKPLNFDDYFATPAADRVAFSLLKNGGVLPPELELLKQAELLEDSFEECQAPIQRAKLQKQVQDLKASMAMTLKRRRTSARSNLSLGLPIS